MFTIGKKKKEKEAAMQLTEPVIVSSDDNLFKTDEEKQQTGETTQEVAGAPEIESGAQTQGETEEATAQPTGEAEASEAEAGEQEAQEEAMMAAFEAWLEDSMPDEESRLAAKARMGRVQRSLVNGDFDDALFKVIAKGSAYERAVEEAGIEGEVRGRNARIEELMNEEQGDGVPHPGANGGAVQRQRGYSIFDLARM